MQGDAMVLQIISACLTLEGGFTCIENIWRNILQQVVIQIYCKNWSWVLSLSKL